MPCSGSSNWLVGFMVGEGWILRDEGDKGEILLGMIATEDLGRFMPGGSTCFTATSVPAEKQ
jgi:hypothetical protein